MKLATWNVNSLNVRLPRLLDWLEAVRPDVVCLQETKTEDSKFPRADFAAAGYVPHFAGQRTYNGVALIVRDGTGPVGDIVTALPGFPDEQKRVIAATVAAVPPASRDARKRPGMQACRNATCARLEELAMVWSISASRSDWWRSTSDARSSGWEIASASNGSASDSRLAGTSSSRSLAA